MATQVKTSTARLYDEDFYVWSQEQAELLRAGRFDALDLEHLVEEVEELRGSLKRAGRSHARRIMEHLLKLQFSPAQDPRLGWRETIRTQRSELLDDLTPVLRRELAEESSDLYARARHDAGQSLGDHGVAADALPETCPYSVDQITGDWLP